jgi:hypothetical protein
MDDDERTLREIEKNRISQRRRFWREIYNEAKRRQLIYEERLLLRHMAMVGATGSGKSNHSFHVIEECADLFDSCLIIDVKREYRALSTILSTKKVEVLAIGDEPRVEFNPLIPPSGVDVESWDRAFADVFIRAYGLSEPSRRILLDSLFDFRERHKDESPTLRNVELQVGKFEAGSPKEQNSRRSLESRLHNINTGPTGRSLNTVQGLQVESMDGKINIFEIGRVDSLKDQRFLAELLLLYMLYRDRDQDPADQEKLRRLIVVEEAHRYLSEERPPAQRGERTLLELAIAEARTYGWGFLIIDQMPLLLSRYVWDNMGTVIMHRLTNVQSFERVKDAIGSTPAHVTLETWLELTLGLPEDLCVFRTYLGDVMSGASSVGLMQIPRVK